MALMFASKVRTTRTRRLAERRVRGVLLASAYLFCLLLLLLQIAAAVVVATLGLAREVLAAPTTSTNQPAHLSESLHFNLLVVFVCGDLL